MFELVIMFRKNFFIVSYLDLDDDNDLLYYIKKFWLRYDNV